MRALHRAVDLGVNFFDTADVYGDGHSERLVARLRRECRAPLIVATKAGRRLDPHVAAGYNAANLSAFVERSLRNLQTDSLDLLQLHCPPTDVYYMPETFGALDRLVEQGKVRFYGVSVERVEEALKAKEGDGVHLWTTTPPPGARTTRPISAPSVHVARRRPLPSRLDRGRATQTSHRV